MNSIQIVKTLPHLNALFLKKNESYLYSDILTNDLVNFLVGARVYKLKDITYDKVVTLVSEVKSLEIDNSYLEKYQKESYGFKRVAEITEILDFVIKGDTITIFLPAYKNPVRIEFFGDTAEQISEVDLITNRAIRNLEFLVLPTNLPLDKGFLDNIHLQLTENTEVNFLIFTNKDVHGVEDFYADTTFETNVTDFKFPPLYFSNTDLLMREIGKAKNDNFSIYIQTEHQNDLPKELRKYALSETHSPKFLAKEIKLELFKSLPAGFLSESEKVLFITDRELFGSIFLNKIKENSNNRLRKLLSQFEGEIQIGDFVVHEDYGIAIYSGLRREKSDDTEADYLLLKFRDDDELYVPLNQIEKITKYIGSSDVPPNLTKLSSGSWIKLKQKIKIEASISAKELLTHMAKREVSEALPIEKKDSLSYKNFVDDFGFSETRDQITAINEILADLEKSKPMNRILVGDVGFGKTEVIMRACFKVVESGSQVAILVPTTVLASQHEKVFAERFRNTNFKIAAISRFNSTHENNRIVDMVNKGDIDIVIGTHRLLSNDIKFKNLNLVVIDEEQKFGVKQKEKLKQLNYGSHLLSVSATPIPRSLNLALSSVQDISIITTPPSGRKSIKTKIIKDNEDLIVSAITSEIARGGQVFFIHNRVETINMKLNKLARLMPGIKFAVGHGQMSSTALDLIMFDFYRSKYDVLISSTIIENGVDLPNVNTIIINEAHKFGLSQLYQLRGRVGRSEKEAYCYLIAPEHKKVDLENEKNVNKRLYLARLESLVENSDLGAGFRIASKDLELRGAGTILGAKQHGHIAEVGYGLYVEMLATEIEKLKESRD